MHDGEPTDSAVEALLADALSMTLTRRMAARIVADVRRNRAGRPIPSDIDGVLAVVRGDLAQATFLRVGTRAPHVLAGVEDRILGLAAIAEEPSEGPGVRLVYVGACPAVATYLAGEVGASEIARVDDLADLLIALDSDERTLVVIDSDATKLDPTVIARFVPDFPAHVLTFVASTSPATREAFLSSGGAFRATLRSEPMDHPDAPQQLRDLVGGVVDRGARRSRGGTSTTTEPARAA